MGITSASQIGILFDGVQPQNANNPNITIDDLTLKLYNAAGTLLGTAVLSPEPLTLATNPGNGMTDYLFGLDAAEAASFNALIAGNLSTDMIALDSTLSFPRQSGGPDSFALIAVPAPLIGHGLFVLVVIGGVLFVGRLLERRKRRSLAITVPHAATVPGSQQT